MNRVYLILLSCLLLAGCDRQATAPSQISSLAASQKVSLAEARRGFTTHLIRHEAQWRRVPSPPPRLFRIVQYNSSAGKLAAYISQPPHDGKKHSAIIWIFGGFGNGIDDTAWTSDPGNDQSASAFWKAGVVTMYPSFRGGNDNPGFQEGFFGEVDDVLAAADYLAHQPFVDAQRIYLGGHSTGGTLALLAAEFSDRFRAVFCFGPVNDVAGYGSSDLPFDLSNQREIDLRAPGLWLHSIRNPVFVFEGTESPSNDDDLQLMQGNSSNPAIHFYRVRGANHFSILAPMTRVLATQILNDRGPATNIEFDEDELANVIRK
jgi:acetyl esterase/lipase